MNIANLSKLQGGYIHNPMITGKPIDMKKESDIFYEMKQEFNIMGYLTIDNTKILALLETIQKEYTEYGKTIDMIHKYFLEGTHKEYFIDLFKNQKITQIISEIAYINIDTIDLILVETLKQFKHLQSNILDIYIQILKDKNIYDKVLCEAKKKIEKDLNTNEIQVASLEGQQTINEKKRAKINGENSEMVFDQQNDCTLQVKNENAEGLSLKSTNYEERTIKENYQLLQSQPRAIDFWH
jgi:hypothetical protein